MHFLGDLSKMKFLLVWLSLFLSHCDAQEPGSWEEGPGGWEGYERPVSWEEESWERSEEIPGSWEDSQEGPGSWENSQERPESWENSQEGPGSWEESEEGPGGWGGYERPGSWEGSEEAPGSWEGGSK